MKKVIDLRSDTVTKPSEAMRKAMYEAEVGDDVFKEDPTVNELEDYAAELLGKEAALFVMSGVMGNQICLHVNGKPGDEVICDINSHIFYYENGSPAILSGLQLFPVYTTNGFLTPENVIPVIRPIEAYYMPRTKILTVENTHNRAGGRIYSVEAIKLLKEVAVKHNLTMHLDGARIWNAAVESNRDVREFTSYFDTVTACLSKGLGAPVGSVIAGSKEFIKEAFRVRKSFGGGTRQIGIVAAAGLYALKNNIPRLAEDHKNARNFANLLAQNKFIEINPLEVETNIVMFGVNSRENLDFIKIFAGEGVRLLPGTNGKIRAITHMDVTPDDVLTAAKIISDKVNEINSK
ncbi:MAG: DegT/DnrJ/EryC1/StrS family aminotransferase [Ignavibacteriaceae bacterium]|nr:DegT/DnrJ/EryC1/StrS family aminotransferase [Ignavibacteriaceae bacterium]